MNNSNFSFNKPRRPYSVLNHQSVEWIPNDDLEHQLDGIDKQADFYVVVHISRILSDTCSNQLFKTFEEVADLFHRDYYLAGDRVNIYPMYFANARVNAYIPDLEGRIPICEAVDGGGFVDKTGNDNEEEDNSNIPQ